MYAAIRQARAKTGMAEELTRRIKDGAIPIISDVEGFMAGLDPGLAMFDEDIPFRLNKAEFQGHVGLLAQNMESMAFIPRDTKFAVHGQTGVVDGYFDFRAKPKDSGYRIRYGRFTMTLAWKNSAWTVVAWHLSTLAGAVNGGSPS